MDLLKNWLAENLILVLALGLTASLALLYTGARTAWRRGRRLARPPRPYFRFGAAILAIAAGLGGAALFTDGLLTVVPAAKAQKRMLGKPAPPLTFAWVEDGSPGRLADFRGRVVLVNIWATWCPPCREEMPALERLQETYGPRGLVVLQISDEDRQTIAGYLAKAPMTTRHGFAKPIAWPELGRPTSWVVDRDGVLRRALSGARSYATFESEILDHL